MTTSHSTNNPTNCERRRVLQAVGTAGLLGIAGCLGGDDDAVTDDADTDDGEAADDGPESAPFFEVVAIDPADAEPSSPSPISVEVTIANTGTKEAAQIIEYRINDAMVVDQALNLGPGEVETISFVAAIDDLAVGEHLHGVYTDQDEEEGTLTIVRFGPPLPEREPYEDIVGLHPDDAKETFSVAPGFTIELVAAEPLIDSPVDISWDATARLWVCEMPDFNAIRPGDGKGGEDPGRVGHGEEYIDRSLAEITGWEDERSDDQPNGAIKVLEDTDGDGIIDSATTFLDGLTKPRALCHVDADDSLLVAHAGRNVDEPDLFLATDTDADITADVQAEMKQSWVNPTGPQGTNNGLQYMLNNWIYSASSVDRFQVRNGDLIERQGGHSFTHWGLSEDDWGRTYFSTNSILLYADIVPSRGDYLDREGFSSNYGLTNTYNDGNLVYPIRPNPGTNRYYIPIGESDHGFSNVHREDDRLENPAATAGPGVYRGHLFPGEFVNDVFTPVPQGNLVAHMRIEDVVNELEIDVTHETYPYNIEENPYEEELGEIAKTEFVSSTDEMFKPVTIRTGPDGALYIVDMYNGVLQHYASMTWYLADYYVEHELWQINELAHGSGRIWRVYPEDAELETPPDLNELNADELAAQLTHDNAWVRITAQRLIVQGNETAATGPLRDIAQESDHQRGRMHALWALHGLEAVDAASVFAVLDEATTSHILANAMQVGEALLDTDDAPEYVDRLISFTQATHLRLVVQSAYSLGEVTDSDETVQEQARSALADLLDEYARNQFVEDAVHSSPTMNFD